MRSNSAVRKLLKNNDQNEYKRTCGELLSGTHERSTILPANGKFKLMVRILRFKVKKSRGEEL